MHLSYWLDEAVRLVQEEGYSIKEACDKVKSRKQHERKRQIWKQDRYLLLEVLTQELSIINRI